MAAVEAELQSRQIICERLALRRPYHTPLFEPLLSALDEMFEGSTFRTPRTPVYSCTTGRRFPARPEEIRRLAIAHWASPVEFSRMIENMYAEGIRLFVEAGPRGILSAFIEDILRGRRFAALAANVPRRSGVTQLHHVAGQLAAHHVPLRLEYLYRRRDVRPITGALDAVIETSRAAVRDRPLPPPSVTPVPAKGDLGAAGAVGPAASNSQDLLQSLSMPSAAAVRQPTGSRGTVLNQYLDVMGQFLEVQREVTERFLRGNGRARPSRPGPKTNSPAPVATRRGALVGEIRRHILGKEIVVRRALDIREDLFAAHHTVGGRTVSKVDPGQYGLPVMPMTFSLEMMAEVAALLAPGKVVIGLSRVQLLRWLPFNEEEPTTVEVTARLLGGEGPTSAPGASCQVAVEIRDMGNASRPGDGRWVAVKGTVSLADRYPPSPAAGHFPLTNARASRIPLDALYRNLFHGPLFQGVLATDRVGDEGIESRVRVLPRSEWFRSTAEPSLALDPVLVDVAMHPLASWHLEQPEQAGRILLPVEVGALELFGPVPPVGAELICRGRTEESSPRTFTHGVEILGTDGRVWCRLNAARYWRFYVPFGEINFHGPKDQYFLSTRVSPGEAAEKSKEGGVPVCVMRLDPPADVRAAVLREAAARVTLSPAELEAFRRVKGPDAAINEWLFGRIAAKDAVRTLWYERHGERLFPADIELDADGPGRFVARQRGTALATGFPRVCTAHAGNLVIALAAYTRRFGVDATSCRKWDEASAWAALSQTERGLVEPFDVPRHEVLQRIESAKNAVRRALSGDATTPEPALEVWDYDPPSGRVQLAVDMAGQPRANAVALTMRDGDASVTVTFGVEV
jgi:malonyl CoA-acyl carrier protein transacylase